MSAAFDDLDTPYRQLGRERVFDHKPGERQKFPIGNRQLQIDLFPNKGAFHREIPLVRQPEQRQPIPGPTHNDDRDQHRADQQKGIETEQQPNNGEEDGEQNPGFVELLLYGDVDPAFAETEVTGHAARSAHCSLSHIPSLAEHG